MIHPPMTFFIEWYEDENFPAGHYLISNPSDDEYTWFGIRMWMSFETNGIFAVDVALDASNSSRGWVILS